MPSTPRNVISAEEDVSNRSSGNLWGNHTIIDLKSGIDNGITPRPTDTTADSTVADSNHRKETYASIRGSSSNPKSFADQKSFDVSNHDHLRKYIKLRSSCLVQHEPCRCGDVLKSSSSREVTKELSVDATRLSQATRDAGHYAYGVVAVEVWVLDEDDGGLKLADGGYWRNPHLQPTDELARLEDSAHAEYAPLSPTIPGVGLAGILWSAAGRLPTTASTADVKLKSRGLMRQLSSVPRMARDSLDSSVGKVSRVAGLGSGDIDRSRGKSTKEQDDELGGSRGKRKSSATPSTDMGRKRRSSAILAQADGIGKLNAVIWRDVKSLLQDPDTAKGKRLGALLAAGFGMAAGLPFQSWDARGIVIYMARSGSDGDKLMSVENQVYMMRATEMIGAVMGTRDARRAAMMFKKSEYVQACRKIQDSVRSKASMTSSLRKVSVAADDDADGDDDDDHGMKHHLLESKRLTSATNLFVRKVCTWVKKCGGGDMQIPPRMPLRQSLWTLLGVFCGLIILSTMNEQAGMRSDGDLFLLIGPFGALMTLQYGLTSAPASQPRNVILGQMVAGAVALSFTYIPDEVIPIWIRRAIAPAFAITAMVILGIPHPPAGAHSVIYASGDYGWKFYLLVVLGSIVSIIPATLVNNMSSKRQYPTFWGYLPRWFLSKLHRNIDEEKMD